MLSTCDLSDSSCLVKNRRSVGVKSIHRLNRSSLAAKFVAGETFLVLGKCWAQLPEVDIPWCGSLTSTLIWSGWICVLVDDLCDSLYGHCFVSHSVQYVYHLLQKSCSKVSVMYFNIIKTEGPIFHWQKAQRTSKQQIISYRLSVHRSGWVYCRRVAILSTMSLHFPPAKTTSKVSGALLNGI